MRDGKGELKSNLGLQFRDGLLRPALVEPSIHVSLVIDVSLQEDLNHWARQDKMGSWRKYVITLLVAYTAPKLYAGGTACEPSVNEWDTWNAGFTERLLLRSALAPSNIKFVR